MIDGRSSRGSKRRDREECERNVTEGILFFILRKRERERHCMQIRSKKK